MPSPSRAPLPALLAQMDARAWTGVSLYTRGGVSVSGTLNAREDMLSHLHGYGCSVGRSLSENLQALWTMVGAPGTVTVGIDANDRVYVHASGAAFDLTALSGNCWGLTSGASIAYAGGHRRTATRDWTRGVVDLASHDNLLAVDPAGAPGVLVVPSVMCVGQSVPTMLRATGLADADDTAAGSLEALDNAACDAVFRQIRWGIDATGHVYTSRPTGVAAIPVWVSDTYRARLGFSGLEIEASSGGRELLTATHRCPGVWVCAHPARRVTPWSDEQTETLPLCSGDVAAAPIAAWRGLDVELNAYGPALEASDVEHHLREQVWPYAPLGYPLTYCPEWGDPRRSLRPHLVTGTVPAYSVLHTSERGGRRGRLRCLRDPGDQTRRSLEMEGELLLRGVVKVSLRERP